MPRAMGETTITTLAAEPARLEALATYRITGTPPEQAFDDLAQLAAHFFRVRLAQITLIEGKRQWAKAIVGETVSQQELPLDFGLCPIVAVQGKPLVLLDTLNDPEYAEHPVVCGPPFVRFYVGVPLVTPSGYTVGVLCVADTEARGLAPAELEVLLALGRQVVSQLELRRQRAEEEEARRRIELVSTAAARLLRGGGALRDLTAICEEVAAYLRAEMFFHYQLDEDGRTLRLVIHKGLRPEHAQAFGRLELGHALCARSAHERRQVVVYLREGSEVDAVEAEILGQIGARSYACHPVIAGDELIGTLAFAASDGAGFRVEELALMQTISDQLAQALRRYRIEAKLRETDRHKDVFLATLAHELRNPLAPLRNGLGILRSVWGRGEVRDEKMFGMMERQLGQLVHLVDDLLDVSRVTSGKICLRLEHFDLREVLGVALETSRPSFDGAGHRVEIHTSAVPLPLYADRTRITQVLTNLLNNACKYTLEGGQIVLAAERADGMAEIQVRDTGVGIAADMLVKVFDLFTQIEQSQGRSQGGLGLGLALVRRLVEMHGGKVVAESAGLGRGSTFIVRLPLAQMEELVEAPRAEEPVHPVSAAGRRILVVDDNVDAAESFAAILEIEGYRTKVAYDGQTALRLARVFKPEVVFLDIGLPGMNGYEVAERLRQEPGLSRVMLVAVTGWGAAGDRRRSQSVGFDVHLTKPVELDVVCTLLAGLHA